MDTVEARVARGAAFLDIVAPGWEGRINLETLDLQRQNKCICGQVFESKSKESGFFFAETRLIGTTGVTDRWKGIYDRQEVLPYDQSADLFSEGAAWVKAVFPAEASSGDIMCGMGFLESGTERRGSVSPGFSVHDEYEFLQEGWVALIKDRFDRGDLSDR